MTIARTPSKFPITAPAIGPPDRGFEGEVACKVEVALLPVVVVALLFGVLVESLLSRIFHEEDHELAKVPSGFDMIELSSGRYVLMILCVSKSVF